FGRVRSALRDTVVEPWTQIVQQKIAHREYGLPMGVVEIGVTRSATGLLEHGPAAIGGVRLWGVEGTQIRGDRIACNWGNFDVAALREGYRPATCFDRGAFAPGKGMLGGRKADVAQEGEAGLCRKIGGSRLPAPTPEPSLLAIGDPCRTSGDVVRFLRGLRQD